MKIITISDKNISNQGMRKRLVNQLVGDSWIGKQGFLDKFNNALGFKPLIIDYSENKIKYPEISSPDKYQAPKDFFLDHMYPDFSEKGLVKFIIPKQRMIHPDKKYSYGAYQMADKFESFLKKIFSNFEITVSDVESFEPSMVEELERHFFIDLACEDGPDYTIECATEELLTLEELTGIYSHFKGLTSFSWHINQYFCETCKRYHPEEPYHTEIVYDKKQEVGSAI